MILDLDHLQGMFEITELLNGADYVDKEVHPMRIQVMAPAGTRLEIARVKQEGDDDGEGTGTEGRRRVRPRKGISVSTPQSRRQSVQLFAKIQATVVSVNGIASPIHISTSMTSAPTALVNKPSSPVVGSKARSGSGDGKQLPQPHRPFHIASPPPHHHSSPINSTMENPFPNSSAPTHPIHTGTLIRPPSGSVRSLLAGSVDNGAPTITMGLGRGGRKGKGPMEGVPPPSPRRATRVPKPPARMLINHSVANTGAKKNAKGGIARKKGGGSIKTSPLYQLPLRVESQEDAVPQPPTRAPSAAEEGDNDNKAIVAIPYPSDEANLPLDSDDRNDPSNDTSRPGASTPPPIRSIAPLSVEEVSMRGGDEGNVSTWSPTIPWIAGGGHYYVADSKKSEWVTGEGWVEHDSSMKTMSHSSRRRHSYSPSKRSVSSSTSPSKHNRRGTVVSNSALSSPMRQSRGASSEKGITGEQHGEMQQNLSDGALTPKGGKGQYKVKDREGNSSALSDSQTKLDSADKLRGSANKGQGSRTPLKQIRNRDEPSAGSNEMPQDASSDDESKSKRNKFGAMKGSVPRWAEVNPLGSSSERAGDAGVQSWNSKGGTWKSSQKIGAENIKGKSGQKGQQDYIEADSLGLGLGGRGFGSPPHKPTVAKDTLSQENSGQFKGRKEAISHALSSTTKLNENDNRVDAQTEEKSRKATKSQKLNFALSPTVTSARQGQEDVASQAESKENKGLKTKSKQIAPIDSKHPSDTMSSAEAAVRKAVMMAYQKFRTQSSTEENDHEAERTEPSGKKKPLLPRGPVPAGVTKGRAITTPLTTSVSESQIPLPPISAKIRGYSAGGTSGHTLRDGTMLGATAPMEPIPSSALPSAEKYTLPTTTRAGAITYYTAFPSDAPVWERKNALVRALVMAATLSAQRNKQRRLSDTAPLPAPNSQYLIPTPPDTEPNVRNEAVALKGYHPRSSSQKWTSSTYVPKERHLSPNADPSQTDNATLASSVSPKTLLDKLADLLIEGAANLDPLLDALMAADNSSKHEDISTAQGPSAQQVTHKLMTAALEYKDTTNSVEESLVAADEETNAKSLARQCQVLISRNPQLYDEVINDVADIIRLRLEGAAQLGTRDAKESASNIDDISDDNIIVPTSSPRRGPNSPPRVNKKANMPSAKSNSAAKSNPTNGAIFTPKGNYVSVLDQLMDLTSASAPAVAMKKTYFFDEYLANKTSPLLPKEARDDEDQLLAQQLLEEEDRLRQAASDWAAKIIQRRNKDPSFAAVLRDTSSAMHQIVTAVAQQLRVRRQINLEKLINLMHRKLGDKGWYPSYTDENVYLIANLVADSNDGTVVSYTRPSGRAQFNFATGPVAKQGRLKGFGPHNWVNTNDKPLSLTSSNTNDKPLSLTDRKSVV